VRCVSVSERERESPLDRFVFVKNLFLEEKIPFSRLLYNVGCVLSQQLNRHQPKKDADLMGAMKKNSNCDLVLGLGSSRRV